MKIIQINYVNGSKKWRGKTQGKNGLFLQCKYHFKKEGYLPVTGSS